MPYPVVLSAFPKDNHILVLTYENGETREFDVECLFKYPAFKPLKNPEFFKTVFVERGRPMWGDKTIDISPNMLADDFVLPAT